VTVEYRIDVGVSRFTIRTFASGMLAALAHNPTFAVRKYEGAVEFDPEHPTSASLTLKIAAPSLELVDDVSAKDRREISRVMHEEALEDDKYAVILYECPTSAATVAKTGDGQFDITLNGQLTLHNVTRPQTVHARVVASPAMLRAFGEFAVKQTDYGIRLVSAAGGTIKVKDELKCAFDLVARP
jgi:polyisoprenoid-binding protein YceI